MIASWGRWPPGSNEPALDPRELGEWEVNEIADCAAENGDRWDGKHGKAVRVQTQRTEQAEGILFSMGFTDFRIRLLGNCARLQLPSHQLSLLLDKREQLLSRLKPYYSAVLLDLEVRR